MLESRVERRLAAILAADVAGYSRLMGIDEEGTLLQLKTHRKELVDPKITEYRGRIVKTTGDGMLVEFVSVVDAVRCAVDIQRNMVERNAEVPTERRIQFRVGINVGDIISDNDDIYGDGVNVAARLETLADPGGIDVSRTVHDQVRDKLNFSFEDLGEQIVKNIARPIGVHRIDLSADTGPAVVTSTGAVLKPEFASSRPSIVRRALELNPNFAAAHGYLGWTLAFDGQSEEATKHLQEAIRMSPHDPQNAIFNTGLAVTHYWTERYAEAVEYSSKALQQRSAFTAGYRIHVASLAQNGQIAEAREVLALLKEMHPDLSIAWIEKNVPYTSGPMVKFVEGMRRAGLE